MSPAQNMLPLVSPGAFARRGALSIGFAVGSSFLFSNAVLGCGARTGIDPDRVDASSRSSLGRDATNVDSPLTCTATLVLPIRLTGLLFGEMAYCSDARDTQIEIWLFQAAALTRHEVLPCIDETVVMHDVAPGTYLLAASRDVNAVGETLTFPEHCGPDYGPTRETWCTPVAVDIPSCTTITVPIELVCHTHFCNDCCGGA